jgi:ankyrin repeat protein
MDVVIRQLPDTEMEIEHAPARYGSAIIAACASGNLDLVKLLISHGAEEKPKNTGMYGSCLSAACFSTNEDMVQFWLDKGYDPQECIPGAFYWSPFVSACMGENDCESTVSLLLERGFDPDITYLHENVLVEAGLIHEYVSEQTHSWHCALLLRYMWNRTLIVGPNLKVAYPLVGTSPIAAVESRNHHLLPAMIKAGANVDRRDAPGFYPSAVFAVYDLKRQSQVYSLLLEHGATRPTPEERLDFIRSFSGLNSKDLTECPTISKKSSFWGNMLSMAVVSRDFIIPYLLSKGANPEEVIAGTFYGSALIAAAALLRGRALKEFIDHGANANYETSEGVFGTPLIAACAGPVANRFNLAFYEENNLLDSEEWEKVQLDIIEYLLEGGADVKRTHGGFSPLIVLIQSTSRLRHLGLKLLLKKGADPDERLPKWGFEVCYNIL